MNISNEIKRQEYKERAQKALHSLAIPVITPGKGLDEWAMIEGLIADYTMLHKEEMGAFMHGMKYVRASKRNSTASNKTKTMRHALCVPFELHLLLKKWAPDLFTDKKKRHKFMKLYPGFCVPENI